MIEAGFNFIGIAFILFFVFGFIVFLTALIVIIVVLKKTSVKNGETSIPQQQKKEAFQAPVIKQKPQPSVNPADVLRFEEQIKKLCKNSVNLKIGGDNVYKTGGTRFGGNPDVPFGFKWPYFETGTQSDTQIKPRPLAFLAQFNLSEVSVSDTEDLLPRSGTLAFFYELGSRRWGYEKEDGGCAKVYWFHEWEDLSPASFPEDLAKEHRFPALDITIKSEKSYPGSEDFYLGRDDYSATHAAFVQAASSVCCEAPENRSKLLGWADVIQGNMTSDCERVARGYTSDEVWNSNDFSKEQLKEIEKNAEEWTLLFQLDTVKSGGFELTFGDCGRIYFYIRKEDLRMKRFDRVWLILQCT